MSKKYKLKCFGCGYQFKNKKEVERYEKKPYCNECIANIYMNQAANDYYEEDPRSEQEIIDEANIARYGEC